MNFRTHAAVCTPPCREVPSVLRYLDIFVSDKDFVDRILIELHGDEPKPFVRYDRFEEVVVRLLESHEFDPDGPEVLLAAFRALDPECKGYIEADKLRALLGENGEPPMSDKELEAFLKVTLDKESGRVHYDDYVALVTSAR
jgi:Ca2+-binding EF-hand superfamily protein